LKHRAELIRGGWVINQRWKGELFRPIRNGGGAGEASGKTGEQKGGYWENPNGE
jgi:hypothetical protein